MIIADWSGTSDGERRIWRFRTVAVTLLLMPAVMFALWLLLDIGMSSNVLCEPEKARLR